MTDHSKGLLTYKTRDSEGFIPTLSSIGTRLRHTGNGKIYTIVGFAWNGETDKWNYLHVGPDGITITRPLEHLHGLREDGSSRYAPADTFLL